MKKFLFATKILSEILSKFAPKFAPKFAAAFATMFFATFVVVATVFSAGVYDVRNVEWVDGSARAGRSGETLFVDDFKTAERWPRTANYGDRLNVEFGREIDGEPALRVARETEGPADDPERLDTAWSATSSRVAFDRTNSDAEFALRVSTFASKPVCGGASGETFRSGVRWFDENDALCATSFFDFRADSSGFNETIVSGNVPKNAASFEIRIGYDFPNIDVGEFVAVRSVALELVDPAAPFRRPGEFVSGIFSGGKLTWDARIPDGAALKFQLATAAARPETPDEPDEFSEFVGPDGTSETFFEQPTDVDAPFVRYRAFLVPNGTGTETPTLKSVSVGDSTDSNFAFGGGDVEPPRVRIVGACAAPTLDRRAPLTVETTDRSPIKTASIRIVVDGDDATDRFELSADSTAASKRLTLVPKTDWPDGLRRVVVDVADLFGNAVSATKYFYLGETPTTPKISLRDDGATLIDGEPFFPIGVYGVTKREFNGFNFDAAFAGLKKAGFNFAHSYSFPRDDEFLAAAEKYGFKLWSVAGDPDERFVEVERFCPAIIAWYLGDDTSANTTPSELFDRDDAVKALDPTRLSTQADPVDSDRDVSNYRPYVEGTDAFLPEIYPVRDDGPESGTNCVAQTIRDVDRCRDDIRAANAEPKAIWPIIQYFQGWGWKRFPTFDELNATSFAAIVRGANGIVWYTYGGTVEPELKKFNYGVTTTPERWANISTVATRINELSPVLLEKTVAADQPNVVVLDGPKKNSLGGDSVVCLLKKRGDANYLIAVGATPESTKVRFEFPEKNAAKKDVESLYDDEKTTLENGVLVDELQGFGVRVYRWE